MSLLDYILIALIAALAVAAVVYTRRQHKKGNYCCGNCEGCPYHCENDKSKQK